MSFELFRRADAGPRRVPTLRVSRSNGHIFIHSAAREALVREARASAASGTAVDRLRGVDFYVDSTTGRWGLRRGSGDPKSTYAVGGTGVVVALSLVRELNLKGTYRLEHRPRTDDTPAFWEAIR